MREKFVKKKKNRTRTRIALENMKRPTVIVSAFDDDELYLLNEGTVMISDLVMFHYDCQTKEFKVINLGKRSKFGRKSLIIQQMFKLRES